MKLHLLFSNLFIVTLVLLSPVAQSKNKQTILAMESFPTGIFYAKPPVGMSYNREHKKQMPTQVTNEKNFLTIKKVGINGLYFVYIIATQFASHFYSCRFGGIFVQETSKKILTLDYDYKKKLDCEDLKISIDNKNISVHANSCRQFCDNGYPMDFDFPFYQRK